MNFIIWSNKKIVILCILGLLGFRGYAQKLNYFNLESKINVDSLETKLNPNQAQGYIRQLLVLEDNWFKSGNVKFGSKLEAIQTLAKDLKWVQALGLYHLLKGRHEIVNRQHVLAQASFLESLKTFQSVKDSLGMVRAFIGLSDLNVNQTQEKIRNLETGIEYAQKAVNMAELSKDANTQLLALGCLTSAYAYDPKTAKLNGLLLTRQISIINQNPAFEKYRLVLTNNLATHYGNLGNFSKTYELLSSMKTRAAEQLSPSKYFVFLMNLAFVCSSLNKNDETMGYLDEVLAKTKPKEFRLIRQSAFEGYRAVYMSKNDFKNALIYADLASALKDSIYKEENIQKLNQLEVTYKTKEIKIQNGALSKENELVKSRNNTAFIGLIIATILTLLLLIALYYFNKGKKEAEKQALKIGELSYIRDQYIKIIAHDIRSPITAMHDLYDLLSESIRLKKFENLQKISDYINESGINTRHLLDNLINWGMSQQEEVPYSPQRIKLINVIEEVLSIYSSLKILKGFDFTLKSIDDAWVYADLDGLKLILRNLIDNAVKNLPTSQGHIYISVDNAINQSTSINIEDNGSGISEDKVVLINEIFNKPQTSRKEHYKLGLGTLLIGKFVRKNKGTIICKADNKQGSSFVLTLPQVQ